jgi:hypothetical protein
VWSPLADPRPLRFAPAILSDTDSFFAAQAAATGRGAMAVPWSDDFDQTSAYATEVAPLDPAASRVGSTTTFHALTSQQPALAAGGGSALIAWSGGFLDTEGGQTLRGVLVATLDDGPPPPRVVAASVVGSPGSRALRLTLSAPAPVSGTLARAGRVFAWLGSRRLPAGTLRIALPNAPRAGLVSLHLCPRRTAACGGLLLRVSPELLSRARAEWPARRPGGRARRAAACRAVVARVMD